MDINNNTPTDENAGQTPTKKSQSEKYGTSCVVCRAAHTYCDLQRPCGRCVQRGAPEACQDAPKKQRGRPPGKRNRIVDVSPNAPPLLAGGLTIKKEAMPTFENSQVETTVKMWQALKNGTITATLDESCCFITASDEFCQSFGYELGDLIGSKWRNFVPDGTAEEYHAVFKSKCVNTSGSNTFDMNVQAINHSGQIINAQLNHQVFFQDGVFISDLITVTNFTGPVNGDHSAKPSSTPVDQLSSIFNNQLSHQLGIPMISTTPAIPIPGASATLAVPNNHLHPSYSPSGMSPVASMMGRSPPASGSISPRQLIKGPSFQDAPYLNQQPSYLSSQTPPPPSQSMPLSDMPTLQPLEQHQQYQQPQILLNQQPLQQMQSPQLQTSLSTQMHQPSFQPTLHTPLTMPSQSIQSQQISQHQPPLPSLHQSIQSMLQPQSIPLSLQAAIPLSLQPSSLPPSLQSQHVQPQLQAQPAPDQTAHLAPEPQLSPEPHLLSTSHSSLQSHQQQQELYSTSLTASQSELPLPFDFSSGPSYTNIPRLGDLRSSSSYNVFHSSSFSNLFGTPSNPNIFGSQFSAPLTSSQDWATLGLATGPLTASLSSFDPAPSSGGQSSSQ